MPGGSKEGGGLEYEPFKMKGSPAKLGTIAGTAGHASALKQKQILDQTEVRKIDDKDESGIGRTGTETTRYKTREDGDDWKSTTYSATDYDLYRNADDARKTSKTKTTHKSADDGSTKKHKTKTVTYTKDDAGNITKHTEKRKTKDGITETSEKTKTPSTKFGQWWVGLGMKRQERRAEKYKDQ